MGMLRWFTPPFPSPMAAVASWSRPQEVDLEVGFLSFPVSFLQRDINGFYQQAIKGCCQSSGDRQTHFLSQTQTILMA